MQESKKNGGRFTKEKSTLHGFAGSRAEKKPASKEYRCWLTMKSRAGKRKRYKDISVCEQWRYNFKEFLNNMGSCPPGCTLDRIDPNKNYSPNNCRWATAKEQSRNSIARKAAEKALGRKMRVGESLFFADGNNRKSNFAIIDSNLSKYFNKRKQNLKIKRRKKCQTTSQM